MENEITADATGFEDSTPDVMGEEYFPDEFSLESFDAEVSEDTEEISEEITPEPEPIPSLESSFKVGEKEYKVDEKTIRNFFRIKDDEPLSEATFKRYVTGYKEHIGRSTLANDLNQTKQTMDLLIQNLKSDPAKVLQAVGLDPIKLAEEVLYRKLEDDMMEPAEKEKRELVKENERLKAIEEKIQREQLEKEQQALLEREYQAITQDIISALDANPDLPKTPNTIKRAMFYMAKAVEKNYPLTVKDVMPLVREDLETENLAMLKNATPELLQKLLGETKLKELRKADLARVKTPQTAQRTKEVQPREEVKVYQDRNQFRQMVAEKMAKAFKS